MTDSDKRPKVVSCPNCGKKVEWTSLEHFRPFCSERCKLIDLGEWATEGYAIPDASEPLEDEMDPSGSAPLDRSQLFE